MMTTFAALSPSMAQTLNNHLYGALACMAGGLVLLIAAVVVFKVRGRRK